MSWTPERETVLRTYWDEGHSASQIAALMGVTRNVVIGKVHRMKLAGRPRGKTAPRQNRGGPSSIWTPERIAQLRRLKAAGLSDRAIAATFGDVSFSTVFNKAKQLGISSMVPRLVPERPKPLAVPVATVEPDASNNVRFDDLTPESCRWPLGHPRDEDFRFCGATKQDKGSYCAHHHRLAYDHQPRSAPRFRDERAQPRRAAASNSPFLA